MKQKKETGEVVKFKGKEIQVPSIETKADLKKAEAKKQQSFSSIQTGISLQQIFSLMLRQKEQQDSEKPKTSEQEDVSNQIDQIKEPKDSEAALGGYGSASKSYGTSPESAYTDYEKSSYLSTFRANSSMYSERDGYNFSQTPDRAFELADIVTIETGARYVKYFSRGTDIHTTMLSMVPLNGMNSSEWAQFKLWVQLEPVMYRLKTTTS